MINPLPTGLYQPGMSVIHQMKASIKMTGFLILTAAVIAAETIAGYVVLLLFTGGLFYLSQIRFRTAFDSVRRLKWFFLAVWLMNICFYAPKEPWVRIWILTPSYEGFLQGMQVVLRVILVLMLSTVLTTTTAPLALTEGIEKVLFPLKVFRIPTGQIAMILSVAIQFIPTLFEETEMIRKAQMARGARFDSRKIMDRAQAVLPLVVPIFLAAFKRADELSLAMEARGYRAEAGNRSVKPVMPDRKECMGLTICILLCAVQMLYL